MLELVRIIVELVLMFACFVGGIAYTRRALRRDPEGFALNVLKAKALTAEMRARWEAVLERLRERN